MTWSAALFALVVDFGLIYAVFRNGFAFSGLMVWLFPPIALLVGAIWWVSITDFWLAIPTAVVTFLAARAGIRSRGA